MNNRIYNFKVQRERVVQWAVACGDAGASLCGEQGEAHQFRHQQSHLKGRKEIVEETTGKTSKK